MTEADLDKLAQGLTEAQRRAVLGARFWAGNGAYNPPGEYLYADRRVRYRLACANVIRDYLRPHNRLTPLGLALRAHLGRIAP